MDNEQFINAMDVAVSKSAKKSVMSMLTNPSGRQPSEDILKISDWFNSLSNTDKEMVKAVIAQSVDTTMFGFYCVLDGVRAIEDSCDKGKLKLYFEKNGEQVLLNDSSSDFLHDMV